MKKILYYILPILCFLFVGCTEKDDIFSGEGNVSFNVNMQEGVKVVTPTRALTEAQEAELAAKCRIRLYNGEKVLIRRYVGLDAIPSLLKLNVGNYSVRVTAGDSVAASFTEKFYEGTQTFAVTNGATTSVNVNCNIVNTLVKIAFDESLNEIFTEYSVKVSSTTGTLTFTTEDVDSIGYYSLPENATLTCVLEGKLISGAAYKHEYKIEEAEIATLYSMTYKFTTKHTDTGGGFIDITVDETPVTEENEDFTVHEPPVISALDINNDPISLDSPLFLETYAGERFSLWATTSCPIKDMYLSCDNFTEWGMPVNHCNLTAITSLEETLLNDAGMTISKRGGINGFVWGVTFSDDLAKKMSEKEGTYKILISVTDTDNNTTTKTFTITVSNATIITIDVDQATVWATKATLKASIARALNAEASFRYRVVGTTAWNTVAAELGEQFATAELTGLAASTTYEYQVLDGEVASGAICSFTTEAKAQPENAGFEYWSNSTPNLMYASGQNIWWDTGNHGSSTMGKNITNPATDYVHSGTYSAKLESQFVGISIIGKFAAGNAFVGQYLETDGTDGILGWGRPFSSRPKSLKGYIKYIPGEVKYSDVPDGIDFPKGATDIGSIFIAIGDWAGEEYDGTVWPIIIRTKKSNRQLFDPNGAGVIAYGAQDFTTATAGDGMIEFEIPLDYYSLDRKPTAIVIVASASKYGDYFSGGDSTMWIDDFELIYE